MRAFIPKERQVASKQYFRLSVSQGKRKVFCQETIALSHNGERAYFPFLRWDRSWTLVWRNFNVSSLFACRHFLKRDIFRFQTKMDMKAAFACLSTVCRHPPPPSARPETIKCKSSMHTQCRAELLMFIKTPEAVSGRFLVVASVTLYCNFWIVHELHYLFFYN